jgi:hypothetical protein
MGAQSGVDRSERRNNQRIPAYFAVELNSAQKRGRCGVTRNASDTGLLIVTPSRFAASDRLELAVHTGGAQRRLAGRIVRVDENGAKSHETWRFRLAVQLDEPLPGDLLERAAQGPVARRAG